MLIEAESGYDMQRLTAEVKTRVDAITTFPAEAERPIVTEVAHRHDMVTVTVAGDIGEQNLKILAKTCATTWPRCPTSRWWRSAPRGPTRSRWRCQSTPCAAMACASTMW